MERDKNPESSEKICSIRSEIFRILYIGRMPGICWGENSIDGVNTTTLRLRHSFTNQLAVHAGLTKVGALFGKNRGA